MPNITEGAGMDDDKREKKEEQRGNADADERDWRQLTEELLNVVYEQLSDFLDCIYFRATCKAWNLPVALPDATPRHPWLFDPYNSHDRTIRFYAFTSNTTISVRTNEFNRTSRRSKYLSALTGWMLYYHHETASYYFINPLTNTCGDLILAHMAGEEGHAPSSSYVLRASRAQEGFVFSILATTANDYNISLGRRDVRLLTLQWVREGVQQDHVCWSIKAKRPARAGFELYKGKYFISSGFVDEDIKVIDAASNEPLYEVTLPENEPPSLSETDRIMRRRSFNYLMESSGELLLIVAISYNIRRLTLCSSRYVFDVYRLEDKDVDSHWIKMRGIGDRSIFLNEFDGFSLESDKYPRLKKNSIYFMRSTTKRVIGDDDDDDNPFNNNRTVIVASRFDLETGLVEDFPYFMNYWGSWYLPSFQSSVHGINADDFPD